MKLDWLPKFAIEFLEDAPPIAGFTLLNKTTKAKLHHYYNSTGQYKLFFTE